MRNLKKILALVLALVMSFSLMATANAFTDDEQITDTYETAVTVLDGLKVFQGYDDGSFQPQSPIRRSEVAAIIYRIVTGDVTDAQVGIYADYNKFDDVKSTSWYAGYVNFCANAEYIKGRDARTFDPDSYVTGYEALAMILRAIGYDKNGEFTGSSWQVQTAATGELRGITKNITAGTLGTYASREVVAEILFQTILVDKVNYTPAFGYQLDDTSLGWDTFELEDIEGVVIANEYADLYSGKPMKAGETELNVDGDSYVLAYASELTDIGEARHAYITEGENVLYLADAGNTVFETGAATDIEKDKDFEKATGLERDDDTTEQFINFSQDGKWTCEYMLTYGYENDVDENGDATHPERNVKAGREIDIDELRAVFSDNNGYVYLGTANTDNPEDYSSTMSWNKFRSEYLDNSFQDDVTESDNGEWLKVIDNDGDGVADYVFLTEFAMSVIQRISKDNEYTLATLANEDAVTFDRNTVEIDGDDIVTEDELAEDDVVIYTLIDGKYYMSIAEMVTETVDAGTKAINSKTETMTCDGTDYVQSHIGYGDGGIYYTDITEAETEETYDLYLDHFGYVRLFVESDYDTFMLLTDGWYEDDNRTETFQAYYWDVEADEETLIDVVDNDDNFISDGQRGDEETWGNLWGADVTYDLNGYTWPNTFASNIAGYTETDDGYDLKSVTRSAERMDYEVWDFVVDGLKDETLNVAGTGVDIQTTTNTQYYLVIRDRDNRTASGWNVEDVITWTGYKNAPAEAKLVKGESDGYAVVHDSKASNAYVVADVVVFETLAYNDRDTYFVYADNNDNPVEHVWGIGYNDEGAIEDQRLNVEESWLTQWDMIDFYQVFDDETVEWIYQNYADYNIYAGYARTSWDIEGVDYIRVSVNGNDDDLHIYPDDPVYYVFWDDEDSEFDVDRENRDDVDVGDMMIVFTDDDGNVEYAINVSNSVDDLDGDGVKDDIFPELWTDPTGGYYPYAVFGYGLWNRIWDDATPIDYSEQLDAYQAAAATAIAMADDTAEQIAAKREALDYVKTILNAMMNDDEAKDALSAAEIVELSDTIKAVEDELARLGGVVDAATAAANMVNAWNEYAKEGTNATKEAALQAALVYQKYYNTADGTADANAAYGKAVALAESELDDEFTGGNFMSLTDLSSFALMEDMEDFAEEDLLPLVTGAQAKYDALKADYATRSAMFEKARNLVDAYNTYTKLGTDGVGAAAEEAEAALWVAFNAITKADLDTMYAWFSDYSTYDFGYGSGKDFPTVYVACQQLNAGKPETAVADLKVNTDTAELKGDELILGKGTVSAVDETWMTPYVIAGDDAVGALTWTLKETGADYKIFTATFTGANNGTVEKIDVTVRNATAAEKVAHDKALLAEALEDVEVNLSKGSTEVTSAALKSYMESRITNAYNGLSTTWGSIIAPTVTVNTPYTAPAAGGKVDYSAAVEITIESGAAEDTLTLTITGTVENTDPVT